MGSRKPDSKDHYVTLGVAPDSTTSEIKKAYRALAQKFHPDRIQGEEVNTAAEKMIELNEAFSVLSDEKLRDAFDRERTGATTTTAPAPAAPADEDWEIPVAPGAKSSDTQTKTRNTAADSAVAADFLVKIKLQVLQADAESKLREASDTGWIWSLLGKTWGGNYWVGLRALGVLSPNTAKETLIHLEKLMGKRRSGWKNNSFTFVLAFQELQEGDMVLKMLRSFCNREENSVPRNKVHILALDANQRRSVLCGKRTADENMHAILHGLGVS